MRLGEQTYRAGALQRIQDARCLFLENRYSGASYFAGLAVEGMLRCLIWLRNKELDERHDLRKLAIHVESLGLLRKSDRDVDFVADVQGVDRSWHNTLRFVDDTEYARWLRQIGALKTRDIDGVKAEAQRHYIRCSRVVRRCEVLWQRHKSKKPS